MTADRARRWNPHLNGSMTEHYRAVMYLYPALRRELGFYHLSRFRCSDLGCWVYYENTLPSPPRSEYRPSVPCGGSCAESDPALAIGHRLRHWRRPDCHDDWSPR